MLYVLANAETGQVKSPQSHLSGNATNRDLVPVGVRCLRLLLVSAVRRVLM
jgi:hypothetical protein